MNGWDFSVFWQAGQAILQGQDPYSVEGFFYPLPFAYILILIALLPLSIAFAIWLVCNIAMLVIVFRRDFWKWLFYLPVLHTFSSGQNSLLWWFLALGLGRHWRGAIIGAFMTLKPQTALVLLSWHILDWLRHDRPTFMRWLCLTALIWSLPMLLRPDWISDWLEMSSGGIQQAAINSPGLFSLLRLMPDLWLLIVIIAIPLYIWGQFQSIPVARATALLASPLGLFYETMTLMGMAPAWLLVPLSLVATGFAFITHTFMPFLALPLVVIGWDYRQKRSIRTYIEDEDNSTAPAR